VNFGFWILDFGLPNQTRINAAEALAAAFLEVHAGHA